MDKYKFTWKNLRLEYESLLNSNYKIISCEDYVKNKPGLDSKTVVNRVDIDFSVKKAERLLEIFNDLGINATFFIRLHASEYNPFSFENYRILKRILLEGYEIGYHSEIVDQAEIWGEEASNCLKRDLSILNKMLDYNIKGVASHGGLTGLNNLDFWKDHQPNEYGLLYEGYDKEPEFNLFQEAFYISDSEWTRWKCYDKGEICIDDHRSPKEHIINNHKLIYLLIHSDTYFDRHFYE